MFLMKSQKDNNFMQFINKRFVCLILIQMFASITGILLTIVLMIFLRNLLISMIFRNIFDFR